MLRLLAEHTQLEFEQLVTHSYSSTKSTSIRFVGERNVKEIISFLEKNANLDFGSRFKNDTSLQFDEISFESAINEHIKNVLVLFFAPWCPQSQRYMTMWQSVAAQLQGDPTVLVAHLNVDKNEALMKRYVLGYKFKESRME